MVARVQPRQLAFALPHAESLSRDNFLEGPANAEALGLIDCWPDWPNRVMLPCRPGRVRQEPSGGDLGRGGRGALHHGAQPDGCDGSG